MSNEQSSAKNSMIASRSWTLNALAISFNVSLETAWCWAIASLRCALTPAEQPLRADSRQRAARLPSYPTFVPCPAQPPGEKHSEATSPSAARFAADPPLPSSRISRRKQLRDRRSGRWRVSAIHGHSSPALSRGPRLQVSVDYAQLLTPSLGSNATGQTHQEVPDGLRFASAGPGPG